MANGDMNPAFLILIAAVLLLAGVLASKLATRFGVPALLLFLVIGLVAGSEGIGGIPFDDPQAAMLVGYAALALILFDGGLQTNIGMIRGPVLRGGVLLSTVGVAITGLVVGAATVLLAGVTWQEGFLLGAIVSSTDAAAVFAVMRAKGVGIPKRLRTLIEFESASNDPTAVFLTITMIALIEGTLEVSAALPLLYLVRLGGGGLLGWLAGALLMRVIDRVSLEHDGLYPALTMAGIGVTFGIAEAAGASGFMAVYVAGLALSGRVFIHRSSLMRFHEGLAWLMQIVMFLILGLLAFPSQLVAQAQPALLVGVVLVLVARPFAVFVTLAFSDFTLRERLFVSWVGLRGAAPIILATFPLVAGIRGADQLFSIVFFAVVISVLIQGPTVGAAARLLGIAEPERVAPRSPLEVDMAQAGGIELRRLIVQEGSEADGAKLVSIGGPDRPLVAMIRRGDRVFVPAGSTVLEADDEVFLLGDHEAFERMRPSVCRGLHGDAAECEIPRESVVIGRREAGKKAFEPLADQLRRFVRRG